MSKCRRHNRLLAPVGVALLLRVGREDEVCDKLNIDRLSNYEKNNMRQWIMTYRHFVYKDYCQTIPISYDSTRPPS